MVPSAVWRRLLRRRWEQDDPSSRHNEDRRRYFERVVADLSARDIAHQFEAAREVARAFHDAPRWRGSTALIGSRDDEITLEGFSALRERYTIVHEELLPRGGHHAVFLYPEEYCDALRACMNALRADSDGPMIERLI